MKNSPKLFIFLLVNNLENFIKGIPTMNNDGQIQFFRPCNLLDKSFLLNKQRCFIPIEIYPNLADGIELMTVHRLSDCLQFILIAHTLTISSWLHLAGMQPKHR